MHKSLSTADWLRPDGFPIAVQARSPQASTERHGHDFSEIVIITGGHGLHTTGRQTQPVVTGDAFVLTGHRTHSYDSVDNLSQINICYLPKKLRWHDWDLLTLPGYHALFSLEPTWRESREFTNRFQFAHRDLAIVKSIIDQLDGELRTRSPGFQALSAALFAQIVCYMSRRYEGSIKPGGDVCPHAESVLRIAKAVGYIERHFHEDIDFDKLTSLVHMTKRHLRRIFKESFGISPNSYLMRVRITRAVELLKDDAYSITQVAHRVGFDDSNYFSRQFRKLMQTTPSEFRRRMKAQQVNW